MNNEDRQWAEQMMAIGVPLFVAPPDTGEKIGFKLPPFWQNKTVDRAVLDLWQPGWALCAVTGHGLDCVDVDPRNGGDASQLPVPQVLAMAHTPSGGQHLWVRSTGVASLDGLRPGVDLKAGQLDGRGRGFIFLPPTVRASKVDGQSRPYQWKPVPDSLRVSSFATSDLAATVLQRRERTASASSAPRRIPRKVAAAEYDRVAQRLTGDLRRWATDGWGGEAHSGLLRHSVHLARLSPDHAMETWVACFEAAGVEPAAEDIEKMDSALVISVPDDVTPDEDWSPAELFFVDRPEASSGSTDPQADAPGRAPGFRFLTEDELDNIPRPEPMVAGLLRYNTVARLFGASTVGKTWVALDLAAHIANGLPWCGHPSTKSTVIYVAAEGASGISERLQTWRAAHGRPTNLLTWPDAVQMTGEEWPEFVAACAEYNAGLIILDTQTAMNVGLNENSSQDASRVLASANRLRRQTGACVLLVHHTGWLEDGRARGSSATFAGIDTELMLSPADGAIRLTQAKQKFDPAGPSTTLKLVPEHGGLVVRSAAREGAESLFGGVESVADAMLVDKIVAALNTNNADPSRSIHKSLVPLLQEWGFDELPRDLLRLAARRFKREAGYTVHLPGDKPFDEADDHQEI